MQNRPLGPSVMNPKWRVGFEPTVVLPLRLISSQVHSTTLPPLLCVEAYDYNQISTAHFQGQLGTTQRQ